MEQNSTVMGTVNQLDGILVKKNEDGQAEVVKAGATLKQGDTLTLLAGSAIVQLLSFNPFELDLYKSLKLDGISPELKPKTKEDLIQDVIQEAIAKGIDPTELLKNLEATAAGGGPNGSGGDAFFVLFNNALGSENAGYPTRGYGLGFNEKL
jgi:hypothetical protein